MLLMLCLPIFKSEYEMHLTLFVWVNIYIVKICTFLSKGARNYLCLAIDLMIVISLYRFLFWWLRSSYIQTHDNFYFM